MERVFIYCFMEVIDVELRRFIKLFLIRLVALKFCLKLIDYKST